MMMLIENLKRLSDENLYLIINIDGDHVTVEGSDVRWSGTIDELPEFLEEATNDACKEVIVK